MKIRSLLWAMCALLTTSTLVFSQEFRATLVGRVIDPAGAGVPNATVTAKNLATNEQQTANSTGNGDYTVPFLRPGRYEITAEATGFKKVIRQDIELRVNDKVTLDFEMAIGDVAESVSVTADAPLLEAATASRGNVIENVRVTELPLNGRNPFMLAGLATGVQIAGNPQFTRPFDNGDNIAWTINGGLKQANEFQLDGAPNDAVTNTDAGRLRGQHNIAYIPSVDAVQEFKILTNFYDSQYGRTGGGVVNVITKSGTNDLHGTGYWFLRRYQLDANSFDNNAGGRPRTALNPASGEDTGIGHKQDQYGFDVTGPIVIRKLYNGKDKSFFHFGFENYVEDSPDPKLGNVPTLLERQGDFSQSGITVYNPFSTRDNPNFNAGLPDSATNPRYIRDAFEGNRIPASLINPVGRAIVQAYPEPNIGAAGQRFRNFLASPDMNRDRFKNWISRVDHTFNDNQRMFFRYVHNRRDQINSANGFDTIGMDRQDPLVRDNHGAVVDSVSVLSPAMILNLRGSFTRFVEQRLRGTVEGFDATELGFPASFSASRFSAIPPRIEVDQYTTWGTRAPAQDTTNVLAFQANLTHMVGRHTMKSGIEVRDIRTNFRGGSFIFGGGIFRFNNAFTRRLPNFNDSTGSGIASLLLGAPASGEIQNSPNLAFRSGYYALYFQDDFKLTNKLTLNLGLRWDMEGAPTERYDRMNSGFASAQASPIASQVRGAAGVSECPACASLNGGLLFVDANNREAFRRDYNNWQPRAGAAYQLSSKMVVRGGYGIFYLPLASYGGAQGYSITTPFVSTIGGGLQTFLPANTLNNPFPNGLIAPTGSSQGLATALGTSVQFNQYDRTVPYVHQYSFGVQRQFPWQLTADVSYSGSRTLHLNTNDQNVGGLRNINVNTTEQLARARQDSNYFNQAVTNPLAGLVPNNATLNSPTIRRELLLRPYPQFDQVLIGGEPIGKLWYDSLQANVEKRFQNGLVFTGAYTWSKNLEAVGFLNPQDPSPAKTLTDSDRTHRFVFSGSAQLPFGRGKAFAKDISRAWNYLIGGWEYNWIGVFQSGTPLGLPGDVDLIADPALANQSQGAWFNTCVQQLNGTARQPNAARNGFDTCTSPAWSVRGPFTLRNTSLRSGQLRNPWRTQWDMSLNKRFYFTERINAQFRLEALNAFNTPILRGPNTSPTSTDFGLVPNSQANFPRLVQLGMKVNF